MVNVDNGTATDYEDLIHHVQKVVKENSMSNFIVKFVLLRAS